MRVFTDKLNFLVLAGLLFVATILGAQTGDLPAGLIAYSSSSDSSQLPSGLVKCGERRWEQDFAANLKKNHFMAKSNSTLGIQSGSVQFYSAPSHCFPGMGNCVPKYTATFAKGDPSPCEESKNRRPIYRGNGNRYGTRHKHHRQNDSHQSCFGSPETKQSPRFFGLEERPGGIMGMYGYRRADELSLIPRGITIRQFGGY